MIEARVIDGADIYGVPQNEYVVDGVAGHDYTDALTAAAFRQSTAVEADLSAMGAVVRARQAKLNELNEALSTIAYAIGTLRVGTSSKPAESSDLSDKIDALMDARDIARKYGANRIVYGSGFPKFNQGAMMSVVHSLELDEAERRLIASGNLERILSEEQL